MLPLLNDEQISQPENTNDEKKESLINKIFAFISGCITPTLPVLIGSGLISAVLALINNFKLLTSDSSTYILFNTLANAAYVYIMVAFAGAKRLKTKEYIAAFIMLALCSAGVLGVDELTLFGINLTNSFQENIVENTM